jgi:hypothetical protein
VTADASGFIALTPEGMAGTSQDLPAAETAVMAVAQGSIPSLELIKCSDAVIPNASLRLLGLANIQPINGKIGPSRSGLQCLLYDLACMGLG